MAVSISAGAAGSARHERRSCRHARSSYAASAIQFWRRAATYAALPAAIPETMPVLFCRREWLVVYGVPQKSVDGRSHGTVASRMKSSRASGVTHASPAQVEDT